MPRLLGTKPLSDVSPIIQLPPGQYKNLFLVLDCLQNGATALANIFDLGVITATKNGVPFVASVKTPHIMAIANMRGGLINWNKGTNDNDAVNALIPFMMFDLASPDNGLLVNENDLVNIQVSTNGNIAGRTDTGNWYLFGDDCDAVQHYMPVLTQFTYTGQTQIKDRLQAQNVSRLFFYSADYSHMSRFQVVVDGKLVHDVTKNGALWVSNFNNQVEDATALVGAVTSTSFIELPITLSGKIGEFLNDSVELTVIGDGTAFNLDVLTQGYSFTPDAQAQSQAKADASAVMSLKSQPAQTIQVLKKLINSQTAGQMASAGV